ncbi:di-heme oxidoreductase family protein [Chitinilyticum litopenaei]|uniref:di-heme oxidoreductase family protein n=1 Tax=Chitinilyticum litopenaei TaxID=1121276 RepID=UPI00042534BD|nr:di-heme oxidoredictase family protein [Chitinilyticum litopenaei]
MRMKTTLSLCGLLLAGSVLAYEAGAVLAMLEPGEELPGGEAGTTDDFGKNAFSLPMPGLSDQQKTDFVVGNSFFKKPWVEAPSSTAARDGLGPHFIAQSCGACHALDGRGAPPDFDDGIQQEQPLALLLRLSVPGRNGPQPHPVYGDQFNNRAIPGVKPEGEIAIRYTEQTGNFADGETYTLLKPHYSFSKLNYGPMPADIQVSPRVAPQMIGLGLLEAIPEADILANAARQKAENKGIAGQPNYVYDVFARRELIGRFGWKANVGSIAHQSAGAFHGDIGITSAQFPQETCTPAQKDCARSPSGGKPEIGKKKLDQVILYSRTLAVPARRDADTPEVLRGKQVFAQSQCISCHTASYTTGAFAAVPQLAGQKIWPYTDLLLHDMGEGLADHRPDGRANGRQWKTPPLWGLGLVPAVNGHSRLLHDGRARNASEAILWHGGEAEASKQAYLALPKADREALLAFLKSL